MNKLSELVTFIITSHRDDDFVDRLNYRVTSLLLLTASIFIFSKDYIGSPMQCWGSAEWRKGWHEYAHDFCYVENTYFIPMDEAKLPKNSEIKRDAQLGYYQWVPFILVFQAICFLVPHFLWQYFHWLFSGIQLRAILSMVDDVSSSGKGLSKEARQIIAFHLEKSLSKKFQSDEKIINVINRFFHQRSLSIIYIFTKVLYFVNTYMQICFLGIFVGSKNTLFNLTTSWNVLSNNQLWEFSGLFPRVTMCDFQIRSVMGGGHIEHNTVQCVLTGNMINEKIFIGLLFWLIILTTLTSINLLRWIYRLFSVRRRRQIIDELLQYNVSGILDPINADDYKNLKTVFSFYDFDNNTDSLLLEEFLKRVIYKYDSIDNSIGDQHSEEFENTYAESIMTTETSYSEETMKIMSNMNTLATENSKKPVFGQFSEKVIKSIQKIIYSIKVKGRLNNPEKICNFLGSDGVLVLELIRLNSHDLIATEILAQIIYNRSVDEDETHSKKAETKDPNGNYMVDMSEINLTTLNKSVSSEKILFKHITGAQF